MDDELAGLIEHSREARMLAYAPFSGYSVGAAVLGTDGRVWTGCNVENASYGLSICAERAAIFKMVSEGCREIAAVVVATRDGGTPCGACRQVMSEFVPDPTQVKVVCVGDGGEHQRFLLSELLPQRFGFEGR